MRVIQNHGAGMEGKVEPAGPCIEENSEKTSNGVEVSDPRVESEAGVVPDGPQMEDGVAPYGPHSTRGHERILRNGDGGQGWGLDDVVSVSEGLVDSGASHIFRRADLVEFARATRLMVDLPLGLSTMKITEYTRPSVLPLWRVVEVLGVQVWWDDTSLHVWHPRKGYLKSRVCQGRMVLGWGDTEFLVGELEARERLMGDKTIEEHTVLSTLQVGSGDQEITVSLRYVEPKRTAVRPHRRGGH